MKYQLYLIILFCAILLHKLQISYAQDNETEDASFDNFLDSLSGNVLESIYMDEIESVSNDENDSIKKKSTFNAYPYVFYTPESKFAVGAGGIFIFYTGSGKDLNPSKIGFGGYYSTNKQYKISISPNLYFLDNKLYFELPTSYGFFVNKYWGIGDNTEKYENASYSAKTFSTTFTVQVPPEFFYADRTGLIIDYDNTEIVDKMDNELLMNDSLPGSNGGQLIGFGSDLVWDSRDNIFFPNSGGYQYFKIIFYPGISDYTYAMLELDVKGFRSFKPDHVFAFNLYVQSTIGETPFYKLPALGGMKRMRGYFNGRYRDNFYGMLQMEYRQYFWKRLGFVVFGGVGNVSHNILEYSFNNLKYSYGAGLRFLFNKKQKVNLRMDLGFGNDGNRGIYFGIQEAF